MKEKKTVAAVVLGVALVSLITALVAGFAESLTLFIDYYSDFAKIVGALLLIGVFLGVAFVAVFLANKTNRFKINLGLAIAVVAYCVVTLIIARVLPAADSSPFSAYLASAITLMVSTALVFAAWVYLTGIKQKEEPAEAEPKTEEDQE